MEGVRIDSRNKALCEFHSDKSPSMLVYPDTNSFYCFSCGVGGSLIDYIARKYALQPLEAAKRIAAMFRLDNATDVTADEKRAIDERVQVTRLIRDFEEWRHNYLNALSEHIQACTDALEGATVFSTKGAAAYNRRQLFEYKWNILYYDNFEEQAALYAQEGSSNGDTNQ